MRDNSRISVNFRKNIAIVLLVFFSLSFVCLITNLFTFYRQFLLGGFGLVVYPAIIIGIVLSILSIVGKPFLFDKKNLTISLLLLFFLNCVLQLALTTSFDYTSFGSYISDCYQSMNTPGGVLIAIIIFPIKYLLFDAGAYIIFAIGIIITVALFIDTYYDKFSLDNVNSNIENIRIGKGQESKQSKKHTENIEVDEKFYKQNEAKRKLGLLNDEESVQDAQSYLYGSDTKKNKAMETLYPSKNPSTPIGMGYLQSKLGKYNTDKNRTYDMPSLSIDDVKESKDKPFEDYSKYLNSSLPKRINSGTIISGDNKKEIKIETNQVHDKVFEEMKHNSVTRLNVSDFTENDKRVFGEKIKRENKVEKLDTEISNSEKFAELQNKKNDTDVNLSNSEEIVESDENVDRVERVREHSGQRMQNYNQNYIKPPLELLTVESTDLTELKENIIEKTRLLEEILESFKVPAKVKDVVVGPSVTRFELVMPPGISVKKILGFSDDIAMSLASKGGVRIEAPIPGKNAVGIEVPNNKQAKIGLREILDSSAFVTNSSPLYIALGKDIGGNFKFCDLRTAPHVLIAGSTGSGKSVCLNTIILSILYKSSPEDVRIILIDPKRVEFAPYAGLPHMMLPNIITDATKALNAFNWAINEMERRNIVFFNEKVRDIQEYNEIIDVRNGNKTKMPYIVIIVDELANLLSENKKELEEKIDKLAAKSRSAGIHLILATQRPSVDVITGTIKNNFPCRIAFSLTSSADSKTILDQGGADKLLGKGDMLYSPQGQAEPTRIQGALLINEEIKSVVSYIKENNESLYEENIENKVLNKVYTQGDKLAPTNLGEQDEMFVPALKIVSEFQQASASLLQRRLGLGYQRASKILDGMADLKYVSVLEIGKPREVFITKEQFKELYGGYDE